MTTQIQRRRGTTAQHSTFTGAEAELTVDTTKDTVVVHDGSTVGGRPLLREDQSNLPTTAPTTGIYNASGSLAISTGGSGRLFVDASGNINVTKNSSGLSSTGFTAYQDGRVDIVKAAGTPLFINRTGNDGELISFYQDTVSEGGIKVSGSSFEYSAYNSGSLVFSTSSSERLRITPAGLVGIGTSTPARTFHVVGRSQFQPTTGTSVITLVNTSGGDGSIEVSGTATTMNYGFSTYSTSNALYIQNDGKVGIGTSTPPQQLSVHSASTTDGRIEAHGIIARDNWGSASGLGNGMFSPASNTLAFTTNSTERFRCDSSGGLLVGTSTGSYKLEVADNTEANFAVRTYNNGGNNFAGIRLFKSRGTQASPTVVSSGDTLSNIITYGHDGTTWQQASYIRTEVDGTPGANDMPGRLVFSTTADGASSPTERMRIGNGGLTSIGGVYTFTTGNAANVNVDSSGYLQRSTSSIKYKTDVETLDDQYADALLACRPVWYRSTCEHDCAEHGYWGFIAEEVASIDPRLVHWKTTEITHDENGAAVSTPCTPEPEGVQYERFVPHLLNLIKRQKEQIEAMEARLTVLESA